MVNYMKLWVLLGHELRRRIEESNEPEKYKEVLALMSDLMKGQAEQN